MTPEELVVINKKVAEAIGDINNEHEWEDAGGGIYSGGLVCFRCLEMMDSDTPKSEVPPCLRKFSTDWNAAMFAAEKAGILDKGLMIIHAGPAHSIVEGKDIEVWGVAVEDIRVQMMAPTAQLAICAAILREKGVT